MLKLFPFFIIFIFSISANANEHIPNAKLVGQGKLNYLFWHVYDAELHAEGDFSFDKPFILKLNYKMKLHGDKIADRSAEEIRNLGFYDEVKLAGWHSQMRKIFPDVKDGSSITGVYKPNENTEFYSGGVKIGTVQDPEFGKWFFGIWLDKKTSEPKLRKALLGES